MSSYFSILVTACSLQACTFKRARVSVRPRSDAYHTRRSAVVTPRPSLPAIKMQPSCYLNFTKRRSFLVILRSKGRQKGSHGMYYAEQELLIRSNKCIQTIFCQTGVIPLYKKVSTASVPVVERSFSSSHSNSVPQLLLLALLNENGRISSHFVHVVSPILPTVFLLSLVGTLRPLSSASFGKHKHVRIACHSSYPLC